MENPEKATKFANEALSLNQNAWKAMLRLAEAVNLAKHYEKAMSICDSVVKLIPSEDYDSSAKGGLKAAKALKQSAFLCLKEEEKKQKEAFKHIFNVSKSQPSAQDS